MEELSRMGDFVLFILFYLVLKEILSPDNPWLVVFPRFDQSVFLIDQKTYHLTRGSVKLANIVALYSYLSVKAMIKHIDGYIFYGLCKASLSELFLACFYRQLCPVRSLRHPYFVIQ